MAARKPAKGKPSARRRTRKLSKLRRNATVAVVVAATAIGATGAYKAGQKPNAPRPLKAYTAAVNDTGRAIKNHPATKAVGSVAKGVGNLAKKVANNATTKPIRTAAGALAVGYTINQAGRRRQETPGKIVKGVTVLGALGGAAAPHAGIAIGAAALGYRSLSVKNREKLIIGPAKLIAKGFQGIKRRKPKPPQNRRR